MKTYTADPTNVAAGRTVFDVQGLSDETVWLPKVTYTKPVYGKWKATLPTAGSADAVGFYQAIPREHEWMDSVAWWNGTFWEGSAGEIERVKTARQIRRLSGAFPGIRGREVWPDDGGHAPLSDCHNCMVFVDAVNAPAEIVRIGPDCTDVTVVVSGSGNAVRCHGDRSLVVDGGVNTTVVLCDPKSPGGVLRCAKGSKTMRYGRASGLSVLADMGCEYVRGRGPNEQGSIKGGIVTYSQLPREFPLDLTRKQQFTAATYLDDGASGSDCGTVVASGGFTYSAVVGGGSDNNLRMVSSDCGKTVWVDNRSAWQDETKFGYLSASPIGNVLP